MNIFKDQNGMGLLAVILCVTWFPLSRAVEAGLIYLLALNIALSFVGVYAARALFGDLVLGKAFKVNLRGRVFPKRAVAGICAGSIIMGGLVAAYLRGHLSPGLPLDLVSVWFVTGLVYYALCFAWVKMSAGNPASGR